MGGIYGTDIDKLSLMSTFPNFKRKRGIRKSDKGMKDEKNKRLKQDNYILAQKDNSNNLSMV